MLSSESEIASVDKLQFVVNVFGPKRPKLVHSYVQPRLHITIEVYHRSVTDLIHTNARIITQPKHMPRFVQRLCGRVKRDQPRWQRPQLPQSPVLILQFITKQNSINTFFSKR